MSAAELVLSAFLTPLEAVSALALGGPPGVRSYDGWRIAKLRAGEVVRCEVGVSCGACGASVVAVACGFVFVGVV